MDETYVTRDISTGQRSIYLLTEDIEVIFSLARSRQIATRLELRFEQRHVHVFR